MTIHAYDGHHSHLKGILINVGVNLVGRLVIIDIKVVDAPLDYKILQSHSYMYSMKAIALTIFHLMMFPHDGNIMILIPLFFYRIYF